jgi:hypothetical protein
MNLENLNLVELNAFESAEIYGGTFWSWLGDHLGEVVEAIVAIISAFK